MQTCPACESARGQEDNELRQYSLLWARLYTIMGWLCYVYIEQTEVCAVSHNGEAIFMYLEGSTNTERGTWYVGMVLVISRIPECITIWWLTVNGYYDWNHPCWLLTFAPKPQLQSKLSNGCPNQHHHLIPHIPPPPIITPAICFHPHTQDVRGSIYHGDHWDWGYSIIPWWHDYKE